MQPVQALRDLLPALIFTCGFDPLRDVAIEYARKFSEAGNKVSWHHHPSLPHGFLQFGPWSREATAAIVDAGHQSQKLGNELKIAY